MGIRYKPVSVGEKAPILPLTRDDFSAALAATGLMLSAVAKESGVHRNYLSEFRAGTRNLQTAVLKRLRDYFESKGVAFTEDEGVELDDADELGQGVQQVFPISSISVAIGRELAPDERDAAVAELDKIVRNNDRLMAAAVEYADSFLGDGGMTEAAQRLHEELRTGLVAEAVYRRVLDGSFEARYQEARAETHADELAKENLGALNMPDSADDKAERLDEHQDTSKPVKRTVFG